jgi:predicted nucleotidyltransferase
VDAAALGQAIANWAARKPLIKRVFIFGSRVRGDNRADSDIDIAVELDAAEFQGTDESGGLATWMFETKGWKEELQRFVPYRVQLERYHPEQTPTVASGLERSSALVYEKAR